MKCPIKETPESCKKMGKCAIGIFLTILVVAIALKVIVIILNILPGSEFGNTGLVILATIMVLLAGKCYMKKNKCSFSSYSPCSSNKCETNCSPSTQDMCNDCNHCDCKCHKENCECKCHKADELAEDSK